jgi:SAM-dependent methyltransferase
MSSRAAAAALAAESAYDALVEIYDGAIPDPPGFVEYYLRTCAGPDLDVLYLGCGTGRLLTAIAGTANRCVGVDPSAGMLAAARTRVAAEGLADRVTLHQGLAQELALGRRFDRILMAGGGFEYLMDTRTQLGALTRMREHLRAGGTVHFDIAAPPHMTSRPQGNFAGEFDPRLGDRPRVTVTDSTVELRFDHYRQIVQSRYAFTLEDREPVDVTVITRYTTATELRLLARVAGMRGHVYGDFHGGPVRRGSSNYLVELHEVDER